jgi:anti-sigma B factor antagonist
VPDRDRFELIGEDVGDDVRVLVLRGDADRYRAEEVNRAIRRARENGRRVVVDMSETSFMDSSMLAALVAASEDARRQADAVVLVVQTARLRRSLEVKGLGGILTVAESREQALRLLAERGDASADEPEPEPA